MKLSNFQSLIEQELRPYRKALEPVVKQQQIIKQALNMTSISKELICSISTSKELQSSFQQIVMHNEQISNAIKSATSLNIPKNLFDISSTNDKTVYQEESINNSNDILLSEETSNELQSLLSNTITQTISEEATETKQMNSKKITITEACAIITLILAILQFAYQIYSNQTHQSDNTQINIYISESEIDSYSNKLSNIVEKINEEIDTHE